MKEAKPVHILISLVLLAGLCTALYYLYKPADEAEVNRGPTTYLMATKASSGYDLAVMPLAINAPKGYSFDLCLKRGFDRTATALAEAFSNASMPPPAALDEIKEKYYKSRFDTPHPLMDENKAALKTIINSCEELNVKKLYFAEFKMTTKKMTMTLRDFDCAAGKPGQFKTVLDSDTLEWDVMERLEEDAAVEAANKIYKDHPGEYGFIADGPTLGSGDTALLSEGWDFIKRDDPSSLIMAVDRFSKAVNENPRNPIAWSGLSEAWSTLGSDLDDVPSMAEWFWLPAHVSARIALMLNPGDYNALRASAWVDKQTWRWIKSKNAMARARELREDDPRMLAIENPYETSGLENHIRHDQDDYFVRRRLIGRYSRYRDTADEAERNLEILQKKSPEHALLLNILHLSLMLGESKFHGTITSSRHAASMAAQVGIASSHMILNTSTEGGNQPSAIETWHGSYGKILEEASAKSENDCFKAIREFHQERSQVELMMFKNLGAWNATRMHSIDADPDLIMDYCDGMCFSTLIMHNSALKALGVPDEYSKAIGELKGLYTNTAETYAQSIKCFLSTNELKKAENIQGHSFSSFEDNSALNSAILDLAERRLSIYLIYELERIPLRWPYDYGADLHISRMSLPATGFVFDRASEAALKANPDSVDIRYYKIKRHIEESNYAEARIEAEELFEKNPKHGNAIAALALVYWHFGDYDKAIRMYKIGIKEFPDNLYYYENLAKLYEVTGQLDKVVDILERKEKRLDTPTERAGLFAGISDLLLKYGRRKEAKEYIAKAASNAPWKEDTIVGMGKVNHAFGDYDRSDAEFKRALQRYPHSTYARRQWATCLLERNENDQAEKLIVEAYKMNPSGMNFATLWDLRRRQNRTHDLNSFFQFKLPAVAAENDLYFIGLWYLFEKGDARGAEQIIPQMTKMVGAKDPFSYLLASYAAYFNEDWKGLEQLLTPLEQYKVLAVRPKNYLKLVALLEQGKNKQALEYYKKIHASEPGTCFDLLAKAILEEKNKNTKAARKAFKDLSDEAYLLDDYDLQLIATERYLQFAEKTRSRSDFKMALAAIDNIKDNSTYPYEIWDYYIGRCYEGMRDKKMAREYYQRAVDKAPGYDIARKRLESL